jgi:hypothetical protein
MFHSINKIGNEFDFIHWLTYKVSINRIRKFCFRRIVLRPNMIEFLVLLQGRHFKFSKINHMTSTAVVTVKGAPVVAARVDLAAEGNGMIAPG